MASSLALRRATASTLFNRLSNPIRSASVAPSLSRSFNTNTQMTRFDDEEEDRHVDVDRRADPSVSRLRDAAPGFFSDIFDPFVPTRSLSQIRKLMGQFMENPFLTSPGMGAGVRRGWDAKEDKEALYFRIDMPGLDKENVKVTVEQNALIIKGEGEKESEYEEYGRRYSSRIDLPPNLYKIDQIRAELKNGVLKIRVPKVKEEERRDVHQVKIE